MSIKARIKLNKNTSGHQALLQDKGYETSVDGDFLVVDVPGPVLGKDTTVNLTTDEGRNLVRETIEAHGCFTYQTRFILSDGQEKPFFGLVAVMKIGALSAFVMSSPKASKAKQQECLKPAEVRQEFKEVKAQLEL